MRKIPGGSEAANILIGQVDFLKEPVVCFARLNKSAVLADLTEVALPTRFIFLVLGPPDSTSIWEYGEIGRAMAALLSDAVSSQWRHHWNLNVIRVIVFIFIGMYQWIPGLSPWRIFRFADEIETFSVLTAHWWGKSNTNWWIPLTIDLSYGVLMFSLFVSRSTVIYKFDLE